MKTKERTHNIYDISGYYFGEENNVYDDTRFCFAGSNSMIDHQKMWYDEAQKLGYESGELNEEEIIRANYNGKLTEEELIAIINDGDLMDTPFDKLFPKAINQFRIRQLESEYTELAEDMLYNKPTNSSEKLVRIHDIQNKIAHIAHHVK